MIYLDDITVYSKTDEEHLSHLRKFFEKCRKYGLYLNPKKKFFGLQEGKILGHITSKEGINIDPKRIEGILQINRPRNIKELQSFIGKINFLRRFIPNLIELLRNITNMLKREIGSRWTIETKKSFELVKEAFALIKALKDFRVYILHSHIIAFVPNSVVKDILTKYPDGKRGKWISVILEYDLEIKPTKLIKG